MAKEEDTRTPEQLDAFAQRALVCAEDMRRQGESILAEADKWVQIAKSAQNTASVRRSAQRAQKVAAPKAAKKAPPKKAAPARKAPAKRGKR